MRSHISTSKPAAKDNSPLQRKPALRIGEKDDTYEREADRTADAVIKGGVRGPGLSLSKIGILPPLQRQEDTKPKSDGENYKEALKKLGEAFLETGPGKEIKQKAEKLGDAFISTLPGKIIAGTAITGAIAALAASHKELPIGIPEIPLDKIRPGLKLKITYEGPVDKPTKVMVGFSIPLGPPQKSRKPVMSKSERFRAETARMAMEQHQFRESLKTPQQRADDQAMVNAWVLSRMAPPGSPLSFGIAGPASGQTGGSLPPPLAPYASEYKISGEQTKREAPKKKKKKTAVQRKPNSDARAGGAPAIVGEVLESSGQPLEPIARAFMESRFGYDFSQVRIHTGANAAKSAQATNAVAYTVGKHVVFGAGQYSPHSQSGRRLLAHELTHVIQQQGAARVSSSISPGQLNDSAEHEAEKLSNAAIQGNQFLRPTVRRPVTLMRQPTDLQSIPLNERQAIQVSTMLVTVPSERIDAFFRLMPSGNPSERRSVGATNSYSTNVPAALQTGLASIGAWIQGDTNALPLNSSIEVDLDLGNHGGSHSTYRFSFFAHTTGAGNSQSTSNVMLIELVGNVVAAPVGQAAPASAFTVGSTSFNLSGSWSDDHYAVLRQALSLLTPQALTDAAGVTFRKASGTSSGGEAGEYDQTSDTITIYSNAFPTSSTRMGQRSSGVHNVLHEVGHALDLRVLERAWNTFNSAGQSPSARRAFLRQRSPSGSRFVPDAGSGEYNVEQDMSDTHGDFRQAARSDLVRQETGTRTTSAGTAATLRGGVTSYSDTDYQELFAEAFALYMSAPETLRQLRPNTYNYFNTRYPRPAAP